MILPVWIKGHIVRQYIFVIIANFTYLTFGLQTGWSSPAIAKLMDTNKTVLAYPISDDDAAKVASIGILVGTFIMLVTGYLMDHFGRKFCLVLSSMPRLVSSFILLFTSEYWMLILGRALNGISDSFCMCVVFTYTSEIASKEIRGALGTISQMSYAIGLMIMLTLGPFLSYIWLNIMNTILVFLLFIPLLFVPETPYFLHSKGKKEDCLRLLTKLRNSKEEACEELIDYSTNTTESLDKIQILKDRTFWKCLGSGYVLVIGSQFTGYNSLSFYLQTVFASTDTTVRPEVSSLVIGCIELLGCFCTIMLTDRFGRKPLLTTALVLIALAMCGMGIFFYYKNMGYGITVFLNYLPLLSIMLVIFSYNAGIGSIIMMYVTELFEGPSRALGVSFVIFGTSISVFIFIRYFAAVTDAVGPMATYYGFAIGCIIVCLFVAFCLPETKGKSFRQIQKELKSAN